MVTTTTGATEAELIDTGEKHDVLGRRRTPRERREDLLAAYRESGLTQMAFARREGIRYSTFCTWAQAERRNGGLPPAPAGRKHRNGSRAPAVRFAEVNLSTVPAPGAGLEVRLPDGTVLRGGGAEELAALVRALRA